MSLQAQITGDLTTAMKARDQLRTSTLRLLVAALTNARIAKGQELSDEEVLAVCDKQAKQRRESIESFVHGKREDLAEKERLELAILAGYLPAQLSDAEIGALVDAVIAASGASSAADMGKVMGVLAGKVRGKADLGRVSQMVKERLP